MERSTSVPRDLLLRPLSSLNFQHLLVFLVVEGRVSDPFETSMQRPFPVCFPLKTCFSLRHLRHRCCLRGFQGSLEFAWSDHASNDLNQAMLQLEVNVVEAELPFLKDQEDSKTIQLIFKLKKCRHTAFLVGGGGKLASFFGNLLLETLI